MTDNGSNNRHSSGDQALSVLLGISGLIGEFVHRFPGKNNLELSPKWLEDWFLERTQAYYLSVPTSVINVEELDRKLSEEDSQSSVVLASSVKLISILPHYFRGFRSLSGPINLTGDMIVIDGRNSSGKTSLAEAFEWLLTGQLLRRSMQQYGDARELECCIANQFRPEAEETWVEALFRTHENKRITMRRVLRRDYGASQTSRPESILFVDGLELSVQEEEAFLDSLFAGIPPILMQHSLRLFVHSSPSERRNYFERLLRLDELTYLIERAVVGNARFSEFPSPTGSVALKRWKSLKAAVRSRDSLSLLKKTERGRLEDLPNLVQDALVRISQCEFSELFQDQNDFEQIKTTLTAVQKKERLRSFPLLEKLRPRQVIDDLLESSFSPDRIIPFESQLQTSFPKFIAAQIAATQIGQAQIAIAKALEELKIAGIIVDTTASQICPLCDYQDVPTLTNERLQAIQAWQPIQKAAEEAENEFYQNKNNLLNLIISYQAARNNLLPNLPTEEEITESLSGVSENLADITKKCVKELADELRTTDQFNQTCLTLKTILSQNILNEADIQTVKSLVDLLIADFDNILQASRSYSNSFADLDKSVGAQAREDPDYNLRDLWLSVSEDQETVIADIKWERAKSQAQSELERIRDALMHARKALLNRRRADFSQGMTSIWTKLRSDSYSTFSQLFIPEPRGKGFPVEIEVKALLDDGLQQVEVDALRVFSESQVNVLGIAAFATRSKMVGHRLLILDDPVQSMDEEHFKTFARQLLPDLISNDTQVIILTHNDTFAKELSYASCDMDQYVTMQIRHSRRKGCQVDEGNRRVSERLARAEKLGEEGNVDEAWYWIRIAIERLYTVVNIKHGPKDFNPFTWSDQTAEYMWDDGSGKGAGTIFESMIPGSGKRLKEILNMSAAGAHDKTATGFTDLSNAIKDVRSMLPKLRVGCG